MADSTSLARVGHWPVRIVLAAIFIPHGISKFSMLGGPMVEMMFLGSGLVLILVALGEIVAGILMLAGGLGIGRSALATRLAAVIAIVIMLGAIFTAHWLRWHFAGAEGFPMGGMQFQVLIIAVCLWLFSLGSPAGKSEGA